MKIKVIKKYSNNIHSIKARRNRNTYEIELNVNYMLKWTKTHTQLANIKMCTDRTQQQKNKETAD